MKDVLYAIKDTCAEKLNQMTDELDADMRAIWKSITDTMVNGNGRETTVWRLKQRDLVILRLEKLGYTCKKEFGNGPESCFKDGLRIIWRIPDAETEKEKPNDI